MGSVRKKTCGLRWTGWSSAFPTGPLWWAAFLSVYDYSYLAATTKPVLVVQGENDEYGSGPEVVSAMEALGDHVSVQVVAGADHLLEGHLDQLQGHVRAFLSDGPGARALRDHPGTFTGVRL